MKKILKVVRLSIFVGVCIIYICILLLHMYTLRCAFISPLPAEVTLKRAKSNLISSSSTRVGSCQRSRRGIAVISSEPSSDDESERDREGCECVCVCARMYRWACKSRDAFRLSIHFSTTSWSNSQESNREYPHLFSGWLTTEEPQAYQ